jgi:hypothetical protein
MVGGRVYGGGEPLGETQRALIPRDVYPGEKVCVELKFKLPAPGTYRVDVDLVDEEICWFAERGSPTLSFTIEV